MACPCRFSRQALATVLVSEMGDKLLSCRSHRPQLGVSLNGGTPKWMVYRENAMNMDYLGVPLFQEASYLITRTIRRYKDEDGKNGRYFPRTAVLE